MRAKILAYALLSAGLLFSCGGSTPEDSASVPEQTATAIDASGQSDELPAGHPPLSAAPTADSVIAPPPPGSGTGETGLVWTAPDSWVAETPSSSMRRAQYRVPGPGGDGELVVFYFGPGQGGDAMSNAVRWANQFRQPDGRPSQEAMKSEQIQVGDVQVLLTEVTGIYSGGMTMMGGQSADLPDHMLLGAIAQGGDANWFFKLTGPAATLEAQRAGFRAMIESLRRGG
jgi:hypothetical protein